MKRPEAPEPEQYRRLEQEAEKLRQSAVSGQSDASRRRSRQQAGMHAYVRYTGIGMQFLLLMLLPMGAGYWADTALDTTPWLMVAGAVLGAIAAMTWLVRTVTRMESGQGKRGKSGLQDSQEQK
ncbi:MAG: AtpZ/AtpI family protein [Planctomycetes bacterium]|nr:AtpZ/AtpI family protein [Planctomycetota bacterium]MCW8136870.1 AtpZ/AtpI family protein [Planctomycetota bacterium]